MKVKPYRICDICGQEYYKNNGILKVKIYNQPFEGDLFPWEKVDICSNCDAKLINNIFYERNEEVDGVSV